MKKNAKRIKSMLEDGYSEMEIARAIPVAPFIVHRVRKGIQEKKAANPRPSP